MSVARKPSSVRVIAFYLPQFHAIPENDRWWGQGFTEWRKVAQATPLFPGHIQPNLPADLGFYDLRLDETRHDQWKLAHEAGIHGFCYYHYWFYGDRLLERPINRLLADHDNDTQYMLCWANENWTRNWDGGPLEVLKEQRYSSDDDRRHFQALLPHFRDPRYIRFEGRPVFLVYRPRNHPDFRSMSELWQRLAQEAGLPALHLCGVEDPHRDASSCQPTGLDASVEFMPDPSQLPQRLRAPLWLRIAGRLNFRTNVFARHALYKYDDVASVAAERTLPDDHPIYRCVTPSWDNTPRRRSGGRILLDATPERYEEWLRQTLQQSHERAMPFVFVNAWNEWAEGAYLEPDLTRGKARIAATRHAIGELPQGG